MNFNVDVAIFLTFLTFLAINLIVGLLSSKGIKSIKSYAIGDKNFRTSTIVSTIIATWVSGEFFVTIAAETYNAGLIFMFVVFADCLSYLFIGVFLAPRMSEFLNNLSVAEAMGDLFGNKVRIITSIAGFISVSGIIAIQLQIAGLIFKYALDLPTTYGILLSGAIITLYSALGGVKSVTFTDVIQFCTFTIVIPVILYVLFKNTESSASLIHTFNTNPLFDYKTVFSLDNPHIYYYISLILWLLIPPLFPAMFQRIVIAKDVKQIQNSFIIASILGSIIAIIVCLIGTLLLTYYPDIGSNDILRLLLEGYGWVAGFKGLILVGIMAMVMSTIDSHINSSSVLLTHDLRLSLNIKLASNELMITRVCAAIIGVFSMLLALREGNFLELILWTSTCYMPIVVVPLLMAIFGFRSSGRSVLVGMIAGLITVIIWEMFLKEIMQNVGGLIPAMIANLVFLVSYHYLFKQKGGWVGIKDNKPLLELKRKRKKGIRDLWQKFSFSNFTNSCIKNTPNNEYYVFLLGVFVMISTFASVNTLDKVTMHRLGFVVDTLYPIILCLSASLISYPMWLKKWQNTKILPFFWQATMFFALICFSFLVTIISDFSEIQFMVFMINVIVISTLSSWRWSIFIISLGVIFTTLFYSQYLEQYQMNSYSGLELKAAYLLLLIITTLVIFFRPKQYERESIDIKLQHQRYKIESQKSEIAKSAEIKNEFLRNVPHESRTPLTAIIGFGDMLYEQYDKLSDEERIDMLQHIANGNRRLVSLVDNIFDLSNLSSNTYKIEKKPVNIGDLIYRELEKCQRLYIEKNDNENRTWDVDIEDDIILNIDEYYLAQAISNLIINAIQYCKEGRITINLTKESNSKFIRFVITDEGVGIPEKEKIEIFEPFITSSKTRERCNGRGIGLTLAKKVIDLHDGKIWVENNKKKGSVFSFLLPI